jgi:circadian clock protein KaiA
LERDLDEQSYWVFIGESEDALLKWIGQNRHRIDCLVLEAVADLPSLLEKLQLRDILLPALVVEKPPSQQSDPTVASVSCDMASSYHQAIICISFLELSQIERYLNQAIEQFLTLPYNAIPPKAEGLTLEDTRSFLLSLQQQRLSEKLRERLGYLGVYYKRNPDNFLRNLDPQARVELLEKLRTEYRGIILTYFSKDTSLNARIDDFVNTAFFADISVSKLVEIHMELMDSFSKQLKLEGRNEEILLDYRLTLIDVIAHLCEMYRRSIPREG